MSEMRRSGASGDVERDETASLISSEKVTGTNVYGVDGNSLGQIESMMITKREGRVAYAVLSFGGFLGLGASYFPIPWSQLSYSEEKNGYITSLREEQLSNAPRYATAEEANWTDARWRSAVDTYWGDFPTGVGRIGR